MSREDSNAIHDLNLDELSKYFHLPIAEAAKEIGVCATVLKKICRRNNIPRWPHRKIKSIDKMIHTLESTLGGNPDDDGEIRKELKTLLKHREYVMKNPSSLVKYKRKNESISIPGKKMQKNYDGEHTFRARNTNQYDESLYITNVHTQKQPQNNDNLTEYIRQQQNQQQIQIQLANSIYYPQYIQHNMTEYPIISMNQDESPRYIYPSYLVVNPNIQESMGDINEMTLISNQYPSAKLNNNSKSNQMIKSDPHQLQQQQLQLQFQHFQQQQLQQLQLQQQQLQQQQLQQQQQKQLIQQHQKQHNDPKNIKKDLTEVDKNKSVTNAKMTPVNVNNGNVNLVSSNGSDSDSLNGSKIAPPIPEWYNEDKDNYLALQEKMGLI